MRILLTAPPNTNPYRTYSIMPLGLSYIASALRPEHDIRILDFNIQPYHDDRLAQAIKDFRPEVVGIGCTTPLFNFSVEIARKVKSVSPETVVIFGGNHVTALPEASIGHAEIDYLVLGEGEATMPRLCRAISKGEPVDSIPGIAWRDGQTVRVAPPRPVIADLNSIAFPAWDLLPMGLYRSRFRTCASMFTSRGCPYRCSYCAAHLVHGKKPRRRSVENVLAEMRILYHQYRVKYIYFFDDTFTLDRDYVMELSERMLAERLNVNYWCYTRVDHLDLELLRTMKKAGCETMGLGFESGSQRILDLIGKGVKLEQARRAAAMIREAGIFIEGYFITNYPTETLPELEATEKLIAEVDPSLYDINFATPYPGTRLESYCREQEMLTSRDPDDFKEFWSSDNPRVSNPPEHIAAARDMTRRMRKRMFFRPVFWKLTLTSLRRGKVWEPANLRHFSRAVFNLLHRQVRKPGRDGSRS